jgi:hypothetical protein
MTKVDRDREGKMPKYKRKRKRVARVMGIAANAITNRKEKAVTFLVAAIVVPVAQPSNDLRFRCGR